MKPSLKLVVNTHLAPELAPGQAGDDFSLRNLVISRRPPSVSLGKQKASYLMLGLVILAHMAGLVWLVNAKPMRPTAEVHVLPMTVSLVRSPAPEPEVVPLLPAPPQPVIKKQRPIVKQQLPTPAPVAAAPEVTQPVAATETPLSPAAPVVTAKAPEVTEPPPQKHEVEPVTEPPRFGAAYLHNPAPDYPPLARRLGEQGRVMLRVLVSTGGDADNVQVETSSGSNKLDQAAMDAVKKWRFIPAKRSNQPISAYVLVPVKFSLDK